jgi:integrase
VAWIQSIDRKGGRSYKVMWRDPSRRVRSKTFRRGREARSFARTIEVRKEEGAYVDPSAGRVTFGVFFEHFLQTSTHLKPSSLNLYRKLGDLHLVPAFGRQALASIAVSDVKGFLAALGQRTGTPTVRAAHRLLRRVLNVAVEEGRLARNPAARVNLPRESRHDHRFLTPDEIAAIAEEIPERYRALVYLLAYGGLRIGEAAALRVGDLDLLRRRVHVRATSVEVNGMLMEGETKGGRPRVVTLPEFVVDELARHIEAFGTPDPASRVFTHELGSTIRQSRFRAKVFVPACRRAGVEPVPRVHDLRHTAVALAISAGAHPKQIQEMAGHASIATTFDVYGHLFESLQDLTADRLDQVARNALESGRG